VNFDRHYYQKNLSGVKRTAPNQSLLCQTETGWENLMDMPAGYAGRNLPDVSLNADPNTGYSE
jgi:hypothetical protein